MDADEIVLAEGTVRLDTPGEAFLVASGDVMLFAVSAGGTSTRRPLAPVPSGSLLFGAEPDLLGDEHILAVPSEPHSICRLPDAVLESEAPDLIVAGARHWVEAISRGISTDVEPKPRADLLLPNGGRPVSLPAGGIVACHGGAIWIDLGGASAELCGLEPVSGLVPLGPGAWLTLEQPATVASIGWAEGFAERPWRDTIEAFNTAVQALLPIVRGFADADEHNRIRAQELAEEQDSQRVTQRLAAAVDAARGKRPPQMAEGLIDVLRLIAAEEGLEVVRPTRAARAQQDVRPTLDEIARASGFRLQPVRLTGRWWDEDLGSLVTMLADGRAGALLRRGRHYRLVDEDGQESRVDEAVAATISPKAHTLMPRYPDGKLGLGALSRLSGRGSGRDNLAFAGAIVAGSLLGQALPRATGFVFGQLVPSSLTGAIVQVTVGVILAGLTALLFQLALGAARQRVEARSTARAYAALWDRVVGLPLATLTARGPAEMATHASSVLSTEQGYRSLGILIAASAGMLVSALGLILSRQPSLGLLVLGFVLIQLALACLVGWLQSRYEKSESQLEGNADAILFQMVGAISKLRTSAAEGRAMLRWLDRFVAMRRRRVAVQRVTNLYESWLAGFAVLGGAALFAMVAAYAAPAAGQPAMAIADVMMVLSAFSMTLTAITQQVRGLLGIWMLRPSWNYAQRLLDEPAEPLANRIDPGPLRGAIDVSNVAFRYGHDTPPVLAGVSFSLEPGQFVALVGASGSGKSTLIRLILGLAQPVAGAVYIDGHDISALHPEALRRQIGVVLQDMALPSGSIAEVVRGLSDAPEEAVWRALDDAALGDDVRGMPMGLHTLVGDGGTLSGGQLQRLALARVLLQRPAILLLDEATSALDAETQARAMASVIALPATRLVIAHRMSTVRDADIILVLDEGRIVQSGRYEEIAAVPGAFADLIDERPASAGG